MLRDEEGVTVTPAARGLLDRIHGLTLALEEARGRLDDVADSFTTLSLDAAELLADADAEDFDPVTISPVQLRAMLDLLRRVQGSPIGQEPGVYHELDLIAALVAHHIPR